MVKQIYKRSKGNTSGILAGGLTSEFFTESFTVRHSSTVGTTGDSVAIGYGIPVSHGNGSGFTIFFGAGRGRGLVMNGSEWWVWPNSSSHRQLSGGLTTSSRLSSITDGRREGRGGEEREGDKRERKRE